MYAKLINIFNNDGVSTNVARTHNNPTLYKMYSNCQLHNLLRFFHNATESFGAAGDLVLSTHIKLQDSAGNFFDNKKRAKDLQHKKEEEARANFEAYNREKELISKKK